MSKETIVIRNLKFKVLTDTLQKSEKKGQWIVEGYASTSDLDRQSEIITHEALKKAEKDLLASSTVFYNHRHEEHPVGKVVSAKVDTKGLRITVRLSKTAETVWTLIKEGILNSFSIGGAVKKSREVTGKNGRKIIEILELVLYEVSIVGLPANPAARTVNWYISKAFNGGDMSKEEKTTETKKLEDLRDKEEKVEEVVEEKTDIKKEEEKPDEEITTTNSDTETTVVEVGAEEPEKKEEKEEKEEPAEKQHVVCNECGWAGDVSELVEDGKCPKCRHQILEGYPGEGTTEAPKKDEKVEEPEKKEEPKLEVKEPEKKEVIEEKARGEGQGNGGPRQGDGGTDTCVCPKCGKEVPHKRGTPCNQEKCPDCETPLVGKSKEKEEKEETVEKGAIPYSVHGDGPKVAVDESWDAGAEVKAATVEDLKIMCTWVDSENADNKGAYKLPHHKQSGKAVVWNGVRAALAVLFGARGGVDIPDADRKGVYNHLAKHYKQFGKDAPEFKEYTPEELKELFAEQKKEEPKKEEPKPEIKEPEKTEEKVEASKEEAAEVKDEKVENKEETTTETKEQKEAKYYPSYRTSYVEKGEKSEDIKALEEKIDGIKEGLSSLSTSLTELASAVASISEIVKPKEEKKEEPKPEIKEPEKKIEEKKVEVTRKSVNTKIEKKEEPERKSIVVQPPYEQEEETTEKEKNTKKTTDAGWAKMIFG